VPFAERAKISSTNIRSKTTVPQKEETFQVVIDIIKNSTCFNAFTISVDVPEIFMQQFWYTIKKAPDTNSYEFLLANKKCTVNAEVFRTILDICPRVEGVDFADVPDDDTALTFLIDLGYNGPLNSHTNMFVDHMHQPWRTLAAIINKCLSGKTTNVHQNINKSDPPKDKQSKGSTARRLPMSLRKLLMVSEESEPEPEPAKKKTSSGEAKAARKFHATHAMIANEFVLGSVKKKSSGRRTSSKPGVPDESTVVSDTSSEGTGVKPGVPDKEKDITKEKDDKEVIEDEGDDHVRDTQDADDETKSDEDETYKYKIHVRNEEDVEMKDNEVVESDKGFGDQFLKLSSDSSLVSIIKDSADTDVSSLLDIPIQQETPQTQSISTEDSRISDSRDNQSSTYTRNFVDSYLDTKVGDVYQKELQKHTADLIHKYSLQHLPELTKKPTPTTEQESEKIHSKILKIKKEQVESQKNPQFTIKSTDKEALEEYDLKSNLYQSLHANTSFNKNPANNWLYHALMEALIKDENAIDKGVADIVKDHKRKHDDDENDDDEDPPAGSKQGKKTKRRRTKESESSKKPSSTKETPKGKTLTNGSKTGKSAPAKEPVEEPIIEVIMDDVDNLDWNNPEGDRYPFDLSKPLLLQGPLGHRTVVADYFFNNDLEYLKTSDPEVTYTTSTTKTKDARYEIKGIKDMVTTLWSTIKHAYDKDALMGIKH
ncbi:hypothetical protein Tco_1231194, partial [Tanacetum coccineum]